MSWAAVREAGAAGFERLGWPSAKSEEWRYFPARDLRQVTYAPVASHPGGALAVPDGAADIGAVLRATIVGGALLGGPLEVDGVTVASTDAPDAAHLAGVAAHLADAPMVQLNGQHAGGLVTVTASAKAAPAGPIELVFVAGPGTSDEETPHMVSPRVLIRAQRLAQLDVVLRFVGGDLPDHPEQAAQWLTNALIHVIVDDGARVRTATLSEREAAATHVHTTLAEVGRDGHYGSHVVMRGGAATRSEIRVRLGANGASCDLRGLYVARGSQVHDNYTLIQHAAPHTSSNEFYRGIIDDEATGTFQGRVQIHEGASGSEAHQLNNNLLLGPSAVANTKPQLEIDNDDVAASHGSTVGQLDENALFYLLSRGLDADRARGVLTYAFARAALDGMPAARLQRQLSADLERELSGGDDHASWPTDID